jgi:hypothetical protein
LLALLVSGLIERSEDFIYQLSKSESASCGRFNNTLAEFSPEEILGWSEREEPISSLKKDLFKFLPRAHRILEFLPQPSHRELEKSVGLTI